MTHAALAASALALAFAASEAVAPSVVERVDILASGELLRHSTADGNAPQGSGVPVLLPDVWSSRRPGDHAPAWYRLPWKLDAVADTPYSIYLTATTMPVRVFVNGQLVGFTGHPRGGMRLRSFDQSQAFDVSPSMLKAGMNVVDLAVTAHDEYAAIDVVAAGPEPLVRPFVIRDMLMHTIGPAIVSVSTVMVGLFVLALWIRRREKAYGMFGVASVLWGLHTAVSLLPAPFLPQPHYAIWWHAVYMTFVVMLSLFCTNFAGTTWRGLERAGIAFALLVAPILYTAHAFGMLASAALALRGIGIVFVLVALFAVIRYALRARDLESSAFVVTGALSAAFAVHDWLAAQDPLAVRPLWLVPYAALFFLTLVGWILVDRFVKARNDSERLNRELGRRVQEKSAALATQLATTEEARRAAIEAQHRAEAADRGKSRFLAAASHDLRQPLHALGLFTAALRQRVRDPEEAALVDRIGTSVESLETLFSSLLDVSRLDAGVVSASLRPMKLNALFERLANDFSPEAIERSLRLCIVPSECVVRSDPVLLERTLRNLLANALKYTERGGVLVGARSRGDHVSIEVWDTGCGVPADARERIFEEFYQVGNPERDRSHGLGLGLAIVRRLAALMGHEIGMDSRPGRGSVFRIRVPRATDAVTPPLAAAGDPSTTRLAGRRILVVDDDPEVREGTRQALQTWNCVCEAVGSPADIAPATSAPDAMLVDYRLRDGLDGIGVIEELRARFGREIPAVLVSGESMAAELARIGQSGVLLLHKPVAPAKLRAVLLYLLRQDASIPV